MFSLRVEIRAEYDSFIISNSIFCVVLLRIYSPPFELLDRIACKYDFGKN